MTFWRAIGQRAGRGYLRNPFQSFWVYIPMLAWIGLGLLLIGNPIAFPLMMVLGAVLLGWIMFVWWNSRQFIPMDNRKIFQRWIKRQFGIEFGKHDV